MELPLGRYYPIYQNPSTAFHMLLFIAKLKADSFDNNSLKLVNDFLSHRLQRTKIGNEYSTEKEIISGVLQGSIL